MDSLISSILFILLICTSIQVLLSLHARSKKQKYKLPPGPYPLNIVANLVEICKRPHQYLAKLAKVHGPIMRLKLGQLTTIVISSEDIAKEVFQTHDLLLSSRFVPQAVTGHNHDHYSLPYLPVSDLWRDLRKICNILLLSNKTLDASQEHRSNKVQELLNDIHRSSLIGESVDIGRAAFKTSINFLSTTFFSLDFINSVGETEEYRDIAESIMKAIRTPNVVDFFPLLKIIDPQGLIKCTHHVTKLFRFFDNLIGKRLKQREGENYVVKNDMLDNLLNISQENSQKMDNIKIKHFFLDLLVAGTDTTTYALEKALGELLHNPRIMTKAKRELEQTIGMGKPIDESDIAKLPYLQAIVKETLRLYPPAPLLLPRRAKVDVEISGYTIPQGAIVVINVWAIGRNSTIWDNAHLFLPERFIGSEIDVKGRDFQFTPFGSGRRICPGLPLAMRMLHVMLGSLINSFDWKLENHLKPDDMDMDMDKPLRAIPVIINN
ncbi:geraniol 8-hydroxylase-like [Gastrolobium bilobum]|uniref:geraniol 8-hydroxylase-like n=1 Tax=Gastrolobium bilobum TaxID=150636 RepID=UPI002AB05A51|nr:geraniol 8-hydroxylase-like [Gastrolobium bilobum]